MIWLLKLYPRAWRRRYGDEVGSIVAAQSFSIALAIDLIAGAIDVWLHPEATMAAAIAPSATNRNTERGGKIMSTRALRFDCAAGFTKQEQWRAAIATVGGTIVLSLTWMWLHARIGDSPYLDLLSALPFFVPYLASTRFTYLKDRPMSVYLWFVVSMSAVVATILVVLGWIVSRL
jgi:hypothetical protein